MTRFSFYTLAFLGLLTHVLGAEDCMPVIHVVSRTIYKGARELMLGTSSRSVVCAVQEVISYGSKFDCMNPALHNNVFRTQLGACLGNGTKRLSQIPKKLKKKNYCSIYCNSGCHYCCGSVMRQASKSCFESVGCVVESLQRCDWEVIERRTKTNFANKGK